MWQLTHCYTMSAHVWTGCFDGCLYIYIYIDIYIDIISFSALLLYIFGGIGITAGAHRLWAHRSYKAKLPLRIFLAYIDAMAFQVKRIWNIHIHNLYYEYKGSGTFIFIINAKTMTLAQVMTYHSKSVCPYTYFDR